MVDASLVEDVLGVSNEEDRALLARAFTLEEVPAGTCLYREGDPITKVYVLVDGLYRCYTISVNGDEVTDCIGARRGLPAVPNADLEAPAQSTLVVLEDSTLLRADFAELWGLVKDNPRLMKVWNGYLALSWRYQVAHKDALLRYNNRDRYLWFLREYPGVIDRVQHYILASFLAMSPVTFSRTRTKVAAERNTSGGGYLLSKKPVRCPRAKSAEPFTCGSALSFCKRWGGVSGSLSARPPAC